MTDLGVAPRRIVGGDLFVPAADIEGLNGYGQIVGELNNNPFFWTPTTQNGTTGTLIDLTTVLQTPCYFRMEALNEYGQVAGVTRPASSGTCSGEQEEERAFLWTPSTPNGTTGTVIYLEEGVGIISPGRGVWTLNNWGQVLLDASPNVLWTPSTKHGAVGVTTPILPVGQDDGVEALGLNAYGQVIAQSYNGNRYSHAFLWTPSVPHGASGTVTVLWSDGGEVQAINDYGQVLGSTNLGTHDYLWTPRQANATKGTMTELGALSGDGSIDYHSLSNTGVAVGTSFRIGVPILGFGAGTHAVAWLPNGPHQTQGRLVQVGTVDSDTDSSISSMNAAGQLAGTSCTLTRAGQPIICSTQAHAFVWDSAHGLHDLQRLLDERTAFRLEGTIQINDQGQILGIGDDANQQPHLLLLTPHR